MPKSSKEAAKRTPLNKEENYCLSFLFDPEKSLAGSAEDKKQIQEAALKGFASLWVEQKETKEDDSTDPSLLIWTATFTILPQLFFLEELGFESPKVKEFSEKLVVITSHSKDKKTQLEIIVSYLNTTEQLCINIKVESEANQVWKNTKGLHTHTVKTTQDAEKFALRHTKDLKTLLTQRR